MPKKIILDVDTGSDDACAIILAYLNPDIDLVAVCSVKGNQPLKNTTENTLRVKELMKADFPVYMGCENSFVRHLIYPRVPQSNNVDAVDENGNKIHIHKDYFDLPESTTKVESLRAPQFYVDYLKNAKEKITIVAVGPLTNLAVALAIDPSITENIEEIVIMGGGNDISNCTIAGEFNIWDDPESAQKVIYCGAKITMVPLDATHKAYITVDDAKKLRDLNNPVADFAASMIETRALIHDQCQPLEVPHACALHDPLCVAYLIDPSVITEQKLVHMDISLTGLTEGMTVIDHREKPDLAKNVNFVFSADSRKFADILIDACKNA